MSTKRRPWVKGNIQASTKLYYPQHHYFVSCFILSHFYTHLFLFMPSLGGSRIPSSGLQPGVRSICVWPYHRLWGLLLYGSWIYDLKRAHKLFFGACGIHRGGGGEAQMSLQKELTRRDSLPHHGMDRTQGLRIRSPMNYQRAIRPQSISQWWKKNVRIVGIRCLRQSDQQIYNTKWGKHLAQWAKS